MAKATHPLVAALDRAVSRPGWRPWRGRGAVLSVAAVAAVVVLSLLGSALPGLGGTTPAPGDRPVDAGIVTTGPSPAAPDPLAGRSSRRSAMTHATPPAAGSHPAGDAAPDAPAPPAQDDGGGGDPPPAPPPPDPPPLPTVTSVRLTIGGGLTATLYAGRLEDVIRRLEGTVTFRTSDAFRSAHPRLCVTTVVVAGVTGREGAVFAHGLGSGWGGAESEPDQRVAADHGTLHQQLVTPPSTARAGQRWTGSASVHVDGSRVAASGDYRLILDAVDGPQWRWRVGDNGVTVTCHPYD